MTEFLSITPTFSRERSFRRLKIEPGTTAHEYGTKVFSRLERLALSMEFIHCYRVLPNQIALGEPELDRCEALAVCFSSCGAALGEATAQLIEEGAYLDAYILDDLVNEVLFNGSNELASQLKEAMSLQGRGLTRRFSPGEGALALSYQAPLLDVFGGEGPLSHVSLNESFMLQPEKSMLYLFGADHRLPVRHSDDGCASCPNLNCFFRKSDEGL